MEGPRLVREGDRVLGEDVEDGAEVAAAAQVVWGRPKGKQAAGKDLLKAIVVERVPRDESSEVGGREKGVESVERVAVPEAARREEKVLLLLPAGIGDGPHDVGQCALGGELDGPVEHLEPVQRLDRGRESAREEEDVRDNGADGEEDKKVAQSVKHGGRAVDGDNLLVKAVDFAGSPRLVARAEEKNPRRKRNHQREEEREDSQGPWVLRQHAPEKHIAHLGRLPRKLQNLIQRTRIPTQVPHPNHRIGQHQDVGRLGQNRSCRRH